MDTILPLVPTNLSTCVVSPDATDMRRTLLQHGVRALWEKHVDCPCSSRGASIGEVSVDELDASKHLCPWCKGSGVAYVGAQQVPLMALGLRTTTQWYQAMGAHAHGNALLTMLPEHTPGALDRITLLDSLFVYTESRVRKATREALRYPIITDVIQGGTADALHLPTPHTLGVQFVLGANASGDVVGEKVQGTDFDLYALSLSGDGYGINWATGDEGPTPTSVPVGSRYTVRYYTRPRYIVINGLHSTRSLYNWSNDTAVKVDYPVNFLATLEHLGTVVGEQNPGTSDYAPADYA